jgi:hypothetical protein
MLKTQACRINGSLSFLLLIKGLPARGNTGMMLDLGSQGFCQLTYALSGSENRGFASFEPSYRQSSFD